MKKCTKGFFAKLSVLLCAFALLLAAGVLAACGGAAKRTLRFEAGEGIEIPDIVAKAGEEITPPEDPEKTGYEFEGWYLEENGTGEKQTLPSVMPDENRTYYGKWEQLPAITLDLGGGTLTGGTTLYLKAGSDLYAFMQTYKPSKANCNFHAWAQNGTALAEGAKMPEGGVTLTALWEIAYTVKFYELDFAAFNAETEDYDVYREGKSDTAYALPGTVVDGTELVPAHYTLNSEKTVPMSVTEGEENVLSVYLDPNYTRYEDVFDSTDFLYELETEEGTLYLDRIGLEGRKKSASYDSATGLFSFGTDEQGFTLDGKIEGDNFYYFRDTIEQTFADYLESQATLEIKDGRQVVYTPEGGEPITGIYSVDVERGVYVVTPAAGDPFAFVLIESAGVLYFRLGDNVTGSYAYGGELEEGWYYFQFDGFGVAEYYDSDYPDEPLEYEYVLQANGIVNILDLGPIKLEKGEVTLEGGPTVDGTFSTSDGYEGEYVHVNGGRKEVLTLDGFGGASFAVYKDNVLDPEEGTTGTYTVVSDDSFLINGYDPYYGISMVGPYSGVNEWLNYTTQNTTTKYLFESTRSGDGTTTLTFKPWSDSDFDVAPGVHKVTNSFIYKGVEHVVDKDHPAFLYFYTTEVSGHQDVDLWYGEYDTARKDYVYTLVVYGTWYGSMNNLFNADLDYDDGMYFEDIADDGSFAFDHEEWEGEPEQYVFYKGTEGTLYVDVFGDAYFQAAAADGADPTDPTPVTYKQTTVGLIEVLIFEGLPANVPTQYAVYYDDYELDPVGTYTVYPIDGEKNSFLGIAYADGSEGGDIILLLTEEKAYLGILWYPADDDVVVEYLLAGDVAKVDGTEDEFTFTWDEDIYYDDLDYLYDEDYDFVATFFEFQYKVVGETFLFYDGAKYSLTDGQGNTFVSDGYGSATLTLNGDAIEGSYEAEYNVVILETEEDYYYVVVGEDEESFVLADTSTDIGSLAGYFYETVLDEDEYPAYLAAGGIYLDGAGGFLYEKAIFSEDGYDYEIVEEKGTCEIVASRVVSDALTVYTLELTFKDGRTGEARIMLCDYYGDGNIYPFFTLRDDALMGMYDAYTDDGAELGRLTGGNGYIEESATFAGQDADGLFEYDGYLARGFIEDRYADAVPQFEKDPAGDVVIFVTYQGGEEKQYVFDIESETKEGEIAKVYYRDKYYGTVAEYEANGGQTGNYLYLDGHDKATLFTLSDETDASGEPVRVTVAQGTYAFAEGFEDAYTFKSTDKNFIFTASTINYGGGVLHIYTVYGGEEEDIVLINDDWSILSMDGFGNAVYIDAYGVVSTGEYYKVIEGEDIYCIDVDGSTKRIFFEIAEDGFTLLGGEYIVREGVLYMYFGTGESFRVPDGVHTIATGAFKLDGTHNLTSIDFNEVTTIEAKALWNLPQITSLTGNIEYIGESAFENVKSLERVDLPKLKTIGARAFYGCDALVEVKLDKIESIGANAFSRSIAWSDTKPLTLDLTAADLSKLTVAQDAFRAYRGGNGFVDETVFVEGSAILVGGGIEGLNAATKAFGSAYKPMPFVLVSEGEDTMSGVAFYDFLEDAIYLFGDFKVTKNVYIDYGWQEEVVLEYYLEGGAAKVYALNTQGSYAVMATYTKDSASITVGEKTIFAPGTAEKPNVLKTKDDQGKDIELTYYAKVDVYSWGISTDRYVTGVKYEGVEATNVNFSYSGELTFAAGNIAYRGTIEDGVITIETLGKEYTIEDKSDPAIHYRAIVRIDEEGNLTMLKMEYNADPASEGSSYKQISGNQVEGENKWKCSDDRLLQFTVTLDAENVPTLKGEILGYIVSVYEFDVSYTVTVKAEGGKIVELLEFKEGYSTVAKEDLTSTIAADGLSLEITTDGGKYRLSLTVENGKYAFTFTVLEFIQKSVYDEDYDYNADLKFKVENGVKTLSEIVRFSVGYNDVKISSQTLNSDGSVTLTVEGGKQYKISLGTNSYGSDCLIVAELA